MTNDEIVLALKDIYGLKKQVDLLMSERIEKEKEIRTQYKVDECNQVRNDSAKFYQDQISIAVGNIQILEKQISGALEAQG